MASTSTKNSLQSYSLWLSERKRFRSSFAFVSTSTTVFLFSSGLLWRRQTGERRVPEGCWIGSGFSFIIEFGSNTFTKNFYKYLIMLCLSKVCQIFVQKISLSWRKWSQKMSSLEFVLNSYRIVRMLLCSLWKKKSFLLISSSRPW